MNSGKPQIAAIALAAIVLMACSTSDEGQGPGGNNRATVDSIEIRLLDTFPVRVEVGASGELPDGCTRIGGVTEQRDGNDIRLTLLTTRVSIEGCEDAPTEFSQTVPVNAVGLKAGVYTVNVNGVTETFELSVDNVSP